MRVIAAVYLAVGNICIVILSYSTEGNNAVEVTDIVSVSAFYNGLCGTVCERQIYFVCLIVADRFDYVAQLVFFEYSVRNASWRQLISPNCAERSLVLKTLSPGIRRM